MRNRRFPFFTQGEIGCPLTQLNLIRNVPFNYNNVNCLRKVMGFFSRP